ncbi:MAG: hypothetical protein LBH24_03605, partial [Clostridiales bacterium]|nr:hypothetical protein [Clostridiales bacterium]
TLILQLFPQAAMALYDGLGVREATYFYAKRYERLTSGADNAHAKTRCVDLSVLLFSIEKKYAADVSHDTEAFLRDDNARSYIAEIDRAGLRLIGKVNHPNVYSYLETLHAQNARARTVLALPDPFYFEGAFFTAAEAPDKLGGRAETLAADMLLLSQLRHHFDMLSLFPDAKPDLELSALLDKCAAVARTFQAELPSGGKYGVRELYHLGILSRLYRQILNRFEKTDENEARIGAAFTIEADGAPVLADERFYIQKLNQYAKS